MTSKPSSCCSPSSQTPTCGCDESSVCKGSISALPSIDKRGDILCRMSNKFRMSYIVKPGIYSIGNPDESSPVLVTANYRLTCDHLR
ncbi:MAG TPA: mercury methylation corrinoid protein HgcA, partial [Chitinispirillaceae bacterium]|nr:mercury methylation corrinoid protein HgcA [Chitinispirillaceae bacterium]